MVHEVARTEQAASEAPAAGPDSEQAAAGVEPPERGRRRAEPSGDDRPAGQAWIPRGPVPWVLAGAGVLAVACLGAAWATAGRVPAGTTVSGVPIGGLGGEAAVQRLTSALDRHDAPVRISLAGAGASLDPAAAGLRFDPRPLVGDLVGFSLDPRRLWRQAFGGPHLAPTTDGGQRLGSALRGIATDTDAPPTDAGVTFAGAQPQLRPGSPGRALDIAGASAAVRGGWLAAIGPLAVPTRTTQPRIDDATARRFIDTVVRPAVSGALLLRVGAGQVRLEPAAFAGTLGLVAGSGGPELSVDGVALRRAVLRTDPGVETTPRDATVALRGGRPVVVPGAPGLMIDPPALADAVRTALSGPAPAAGDPRTAAVATNAVDPALTTQEAQALGITERVSTFATNLTDNPLRTDNLRVAARTVNGTLVLPGQIFSLNAVLGERTGAKGYHEAPAISGGRLVSDVGGGVSQMATTIFNNVFFSGMEDVFHKPHSFFISRYPEGREATVDWPTVDLKWRNDSPYGVLIQASVSGGQVHVSFWSTKMWEIKAEKGQRTNFRAPGTVFDPSPGCVAQAPNGGFDVTVRRLFYRGGQLIRTETLHTTYIAEDHVICGPDPNATTVPGAT